MMANPKPLVLLSLIWTILVGLAATDDQLEWKYLRCEPERPDDIWDDLNGKLAEISPEGVSLETVHKVLIALRHMKIGDLKAEELLALSDITEEKCTLAEFERRHDYADFYSNSPLEEYIRHHNKALKTHCRELGKEFSKEFKEATELDESIIKAVIEKNDRKSKDFAVNLQIASDKYVESLPGKLNYVLQARQLRILHACNNLARFISIAADVSLIIQIGSDIGPVCVSLREHFRKFSRFRRNLRIASKIAKRALIVAAISTAIVSVVAVGFLPSTVVSPVTAGIFSFVGPYMSR